MNTVELRPVESLLVTRDEARLVKQAARLTTNMDLVKACAHYLGMRISGNQNLRTLKESDSPIEKELVLHSRQLVEHPTDSVEDLRYHYFPEMARAAFAAVALAEQGGLLADTELELASAFMARAGQPEVA